MKDKIKNMASKLVASVSGIILPLWSMIYRQRSSSEPVSMITEFIDNFLDQLSRGATSFFINIVNTAGRKKLVHPDTNIVLRDNGPGLPTDPNGIPEFARYMHTHGGDMSGAPAGQATSKFGVGSKMAAYCMATQILIVSKSKGCPAYVSFCDYKELGKDDGSDESHKCFIWERDYYDTHDRPPTLREMIEDKNFPSKSIKKSVKDHFDVFLNEDYSGLGYILGDTFHCGWDESGNSFWHAFNKTGIDTALRSLKSPLDNPVFTPLAGRYIRQAHQDYKIFVGEDEVMVPSIDNYYKVYYNKEEKKFDIAPEKYWREEPEFNFDEHVEVTRDSKNEVPSGNVEHLQPARVKIRKTKKEIPKEILSGLLFKGGISIARRGSIIVQDWRSTKPKNVKDAVGHSRSLWALAKERANGLSVLISHECTTSSDTCWGVTPDKTLRKHEGCKSELFATEFVEKLKPAEKLINDTYEREDKDNLGPIKGMNEVCDFFSVYMKEHFGTQKYNESDPTNQTSTTPTGKGSNPGSHGNLPENPIRGMSVALDDSDKSPTVSFEWNESVSGKSKSLVIKTKHSTCRCRGVGKDFGTTAYFISEIIAQKKHPKDQESREEEINDMMSRYLNSVRNKEEIV